MNVEAETGCWLHKPEGMAEIAGKPAIAGAEGWHRLAALPASAGSSPGSWTSSLWDLGDSQFLLFKLPCLWDSVIAASYRGQESSLPGNLGGPPNEGTLLPSIDREGVSPQAKGLGPLARAQGGQQLRGVHHAADTKPL